MRLPALYVAHQWVWKLQGSDLHNRETGFVDRFADLIRCRPAIPIVHDDHFRLQVARNRLDPWQPGYSLGNGVQAAFTAHRRYIQF